MEEPHPNYEIIKRYKELGGKYITIGSDAHRSKDLGSDFDKACEILEDLEINEITIYENRKPILIKMQEE